MAARKRRQYSRGDWIVGALRGSWPMPTDLTQRSSALSHVYCAARQAPPQPKQVVLHIRESFDKEM